MPVGGEHNIAVSVTQEKEANCEVAYQFPIHFENGYEIMIAEIGYWYADDPCKFTETFKENYKHGNWRAIKRYRLVQGEYHLTDVRVLDLPVSHKGTGRQTSIGRITVLSNNLNYCRVFLRKSEIKKANSSDCLAFSRGSQRVKYLSASPCSVMACAPPIHSVTFCPVISQWIPPG
jgi:hypothetical protein